MADFCLVHGAWGDDACWGLLVEELGRLGHSSTTPVLPIDDPEASFLDYAELTIRALGDSPGPIVVGHSMSSAVIPLVAIRRSVKLLVYLCPAMGGFSELEDEPPYQRAGYRPADRDEHWTWWPRERALRELYGRLDRELAGRLADRLRRQSRTPSEAPYPLERPPDVPSAFIYAREDELFDDEWSRWIARRMLGVEAIELPGGHFPMLEHPAALADALERVASGEQNVRPNS